jgi:[ribosomal protein S5]-alanine N-acetyltransferase
MKNRSFPTIETERLHLFEISKRHIPAMYQLFTDPEVTKFYHVLPVKNLNDMAVIIQMLKSKYEKAEAVRWGISLKNSDHLIGTIGFNNYSKGHRAAVAYALMPGYWRQGYMTEAISAVLEFGFRKLNLIRIEAEVMPGNDASEKLLQKNGFRFEGLLKQWLIWEGKYFDINMYSILSENRMKGNSG